MKRSLNGLSPELVLTANRRDNFRGLVPLDVQTLNRGVSEIISMYRGLHWILASNLILKTSTCTEIDGTEAQAYIKVKVS